MTVHDAVDSRYVPLAYSSLDPVQRYRMGGSDV